MTYCRWSLIPRDASLGLNDGSEFYEEVNRAVVDVLAVQRQNQARPCYFLRHAPNYPVHDRLCHSTENTVHLSRPPLGKEVGRCRATKVKERKKSRARVPKCIQNSKYSAEKAARH